MTEEFRLPWGNRLARAILLPVFHGIFHSFCQVKVTGLENIPLKQPYLVVFNHVSIFEAPFIASYWPEALEVLGAKEVWERGVQGWLAQLYGGIPINRGEVDRTAIYKVLSVIQSGKSLMIAPEGTRSHQPGMQIGKPGVAFIYEKMKVPIVPVGVEGTTEDLLSNVIHLRHPFLAMNIGTPFMLPEDLGAGMKRADAYQVQVDFIMKKIAALVPPEYRGVYA